jgi:hypothetical protein
MKGTTFEYSGQFGTGSAGMLTRDGSGKCEWKSPGGFLCWYVGDWRDDRPHGWGRSGRGALVESGVFEEGKLSLKGWPEILDSGIKTLSDEPRWPAQRGRSEATNPDPEPHKLPSARISPPEPPAVKRPPWYLRLSLTNPEAKDEKEMPLKSIKSSKTSVDVDRVAIASYKPFCCFWSEGSCEKCPSDGDSMNLSEAYRMGCIASHLAQENAATNLEKEQQTGVFVLVCSSGNESCNIVLFGNKLAGLPQEFAGAVSPQTRMRNGFGICIWHSALYGNCWYDILDFFAAGHTFLILCEGTGACGKMVREICQFSCRVIFYHLNITDYPCGWGRAGFGVGGLKGSALVPDSAMNVCGWFGQDADESTQKCETVWQR